MSLQYKQGNIIDALKKGEIDYLMHQVNCEGEMGAGIARSIAYHFPNTEKEYLEFCKGDACFGMYTISTDSVISTFSQYYKGPPTNRMLPWENNRLSYELPDNYHNRFVALKDTVEIINLNVILENPNVKIGIPLIASGMAADRSKKEKFVKPFGNADADMLYFKEYIAPIFEPYDNFICYYL